MTESRRCPLATWSALEKISLKCKSEPSDVHDPSVGTKEKDQVSAGERSGKCSSGCSRSLSNLKDVIHGGKRHVRDKQKPPDPTGTPRSLASSLGDIFNHITGEGVVVSDSKFEFQMTAKPIPEETCSEVRNSTEAKSRGFICHKCDENFTTLEAIEVHHLSQHAVTELLEGDSSRNIVELICQTRPLRSDDQHMIRGPAERVLKVHNTERTLARYEEYRGSVMAKASKLCSKKHPRCQADGNELLRFYGTTVACSLGLNSSMNVCSSNKCGVCQILRHGFPVKDVGDGMRGVFTCSTSKRAMEVVEVDGGDEEAPRKCLIVCRVVAGRVHKPVKGFQDIGGQSPFDSVAGRVGPHSRIEDLYLPNPTALLPCFAIIFQPTILS